MRRGVRWPICDGISKSGVKWLLRRAHVIGARDGASVCAMAANWRRSEHSCVGSTVRGADAFQPQNIVAGGKQRMEGSQEMIMRRITGLTPQAADAIGAALDKLSGDRICISMKEYNDLCVSQDLTSVVAREVLESLASEGRVLHFAATAEASSPFSNMVILRDHVWARTILQEALLRELPVGDYVVLAEKRDEVEQKLRDIENRLDHYVDIRRYADGWDDIKVAHAASHVAGRHRVC